MAGPTEAQVRAELAKVPGAGQLLDGVAVKDGHIQVALAIDPAQAQQAEPVRRQAETALRALPGVLSATVVLTANRDPAQQSPAPAQRGAAPRQHSPQQSPMNPEPVPGVGAVIAVASGKGGVGKSTVAANLAVALAQSGLRVGLMDADVYGPSVPRMLGVNRKPDSDGQMLLPLEAHGVKLMSMGFMVEERTAMIWRGPMVMSAVQQMIFQVQWGALDVLVLDLPPGTGDAQLTIAQKVKLAGAVIVSTPQDIALLDVRRGMTMFEKVNVPVFGLVENMSMYICPNCGHEAHIFGHGGAAAEAKALGCDFLGEIPLSLPIREQSDAGAPIVVAQPGSPEAEAFRTLAARVRAKL
ncbi:MAG: Mrp/NBP35 family ATP-binding protein [Alphaproteobacteria bacterium]|nr:Mrp/NBP35 family ATP-binding protein [Alphaproteobacteria bacterium]MCB9929661.1 Mrp/NBP35 family ATP-binding protein [Alphaproteobacteria bacterium]